MTKCNLYNGDKEAHTQHAATSSIFTIHIVITLLTLMATSIPNGSKIIAILCAEHVHIVEFEMNFSI